MNELDLGVLISGTGTNLQAILDAIGTGALPARVRLVVSNKAAAPGLERARRAGVPCQVISHRDYASREQFDAALAAALEQAGVSWVVLAGFMRILTPTFLKAFPQRVVNIHPALCPAFPGIDAQQQALDYGVRVAGCTVHLVDEGVDTGPILAQGVVPVRDGDTRDVLAGRLLRREHETLVSALRWIAEGRVTVLEPSEAGQRPRVRVDGVVPALGLSEGAPPSPDRGG